MREREEEKFTRPDSATPLPPPSKTARVLRFYDVSHSALFAIAGMAVAMVLGAAIWKHPEFRAAAIAKLKAAVTTRKPAPPASPPPVVDSPAVVNRPPVQPPAPPDQGSPTVRRVDSDEARLRQEREKRNRLLVEQREGELEQVRRQAEKERHDLELREQLAKEAQDRAERAATAERAERERAEALIAAARAEQARAEEQARFAKAEKERFEAAEMVKQREAATLAKAEAERIKNYAGPKFGTVVWEGDVHGTEMVMIENGVASIGSATGALPGVPAFLQPLEPNRVGIVSSPAPSNKYRSMTFRVKGNGHMKLTFRWSIQ
jgi:FKBP-type peptidyl-prolyl cis-trans isomerase